MVMTGLNMDQSAMIQCLGVTGNEFYLWKNQEIKDMIIDFKRPQPSITYMTFQVTDSDPIHVIVLKPD